MSAIETIARVGVVPVVTIDRVDDAVGLASALVEGGLPVMEITLRTPVGLEAIARVADREPEILVGAGSVTSAAAASSAVDAGARFVVSPGLDAGMVRTSPDRGVPVIPGVATATELMRAMALGVDVVKVFPADVIGGPRLIEALAAVWPQVRFLPTGGISATNAAPYLALPSVLALGGSWMVPRPAVAARDWTSITELAVAAAALVSKEGRR
jgi:2-dehydro-3-deoxyphosphogluconate aldolase/(4S)-4-hydroxy-2-oxoglutarate aldolase